MEKDIFRFDLPMDIVKSKDPDKTEEMRIAGYASTSDEDRQGDSIVQKGLDISDFVDSGFFNFDHDSTKILGYPDKERTRIDSHGFYTEGLLLPTKLAKSIWEAAVALKKSNAPRRFGFSVEGKTLQRDAFGKIVKAKVYHVAITPSPVNTKATWEALCKSFSDELRTDTEKSISAGYSTSIGETNNGSCLKTEDLEASFRVIAKALGGNEEAVKELNKLKEHMSLNKSVDTDELTLYYQLTKGLSRTEAVNLVKRQRQLILSEIYNK